MSFGSLGTGGFSVPGGGGTFGGGMFGGPIMGGTGGSGDVIDTGNEFVDTIGSTVIERGSNRLLDEIGLGQDQDFGAPSGGTQAPYTPGATGQGSGQTDAPTGRERPGGNGQPGVTPIFRPPPRDDSGGGEQQEAGVIGDTASLAQNLVIGIALFFAYQLYTDLA